MQYGQSGNLRFHHFYVCNCSACKNIRKFFLRDEHRWMTAPAISFGREWTEHNTVSETELQYGLVRTGWSDL